MKLIIKTCALILIGALIFSCQNSTSKSYIIKDHTALKLEIAGEWTQFFDAWVKGDAPKSASFFTENGIHFRPGAAIDSGRVNIEKTFSKMLSAFKVEYCHQTTVEIEMFENTIIEYGTYEQKWELADDIMKGSYIAVWKKTDQDSIRISRLIFN